MYLGVSTAASLRMMALHASEGAGLVDAPSTPQAVSGRSTRGSTSVGWCHGNDHKHKACSMTSFPLQICSKGHAKKVLSTNADNPSGGGERIGAGDSARTNVQERPIIGSLEPTSRTTRKISKLAIDEINMSDV